MEDDLWWKTTFGGRQPLVEYDLRWKVEDDLQWKTTFSGRLPLVEEDPQWKTTFGRRRLSVEADIAHAMHHPLLCGIFITRPFSSVQACFPKFWTPLKYSK